MDASPRKKPLIRFLGITKRFPGVVALRNVSFDVLPGSCHALLGENGAGKSTLGKILAGIYRPDEGQVELDGAARHFDSPLDARRSGIGTVHQELACCPNLSAAENIFLGAPRRRGLFLDRKRLWADARLLLDQVGAECDPRDELGRLPTAQVQLVQIASALSSGARIIIMDEPTSSLSAAETGRLHAIVRKLGDEGTTVLYVSHRLEEVFEICDVVTVLRDGQHVETLPVEGTCQDDLVRKMIGRPVSRYYPGQARWERGAELLRLERLSSPGKFYDVSFSLHAGEVLGLAGLVGAGRSEVALSIFGLNAKVRGRILVRGRQASIRSPRQAMALGIGLVPEDRKRQGLILGMSAGHNASLSSLQRLARLGFISRRLESQMISEYFERLQVRAPDPGAPAAGLSGGNQQKLVLAKWLARHCRILIFDEPTRGVDVGAKSEIHALIAELALAGSGVLLISSELPEILNLSTRILVLRQGRVAGELSHGEATEEKVMQWMAGVHG